MAITVSPQIVVDDDGSGTTGSVWNAAFQAGFEAAINTALTAAAPLASPALTGTPTAPTATVGTNTAQIATTSFVLANGGSGGTVDPGICEGRLTLTSGVPVTIADVTGATAIKWTPYKGKYVALYNGSAWVMRAFAETSLAMGTLINGQAYDVFVFDNAGTLNLTLTEWANAAITMTIATPAVVTWTAHGMVTGNVITFTNSGGALPTGLATQTQYFVTVVDANSFKLSTTMANVVAGTFIATSGSQSGTHTGHHPQARQTAIVLQDGVKVLSGALTQRLVATIYMSSTTTTEDSLAKRFVSNLYNAVPRRLRRQDASASWTSTGLVTFRQANNNTVANQVEVVCVSDDGIADASYQSPSVTDTTASLTAAQAGIGIDSITTASEACTIVSLASSGSQLSASVRALLPLSAGYHRIIMLEKGGNGAGTTTWFGAGTYTGAAAMGAVVMG